MCLDKSYADRCFESDLSYLLWGMMEGELGLVRYGYPVRDVCDEPESLILAQSERWRHA